MQAVHRRATAALVIAASATAANAELIAFGTSPLPGDATQLVAFDPADPLTLTVVGDTGIDLPMFGLDAVDGRLYAYATGAFTGASGGGGLYELDPNTGQASFIGGQDLFGRTVSDLAYNPANGVLYGVGRLGGSSAIFEIDTQTGLASNFRNVTNSGNHEFTGFAFDANGNAFLVEDDTDRLWTAVFDGPPIAWYTDALNPPISGPFPGQFAGDQGLYIDHQGSGDILMAANNSISHDLRTLDGTNGTLIAEREWGRLATNMNVEPTVWDLTFIPAPGTAALLAPAALAATRRRR